MNPASDMAIVAAAKRGHMDRIAQHAEETRAAMDAAARLAKEFRAQLETIPPRAAVDHTKLLAGFANPLPERPRPAAEAIEELAAAAAPGLTGNAGPNFFGWVQGGSHGAGVAADWLTSAWGQNIGPYRTSPAAAVAEMVCTNYLLDLLDLPRGASIGFASGATTASLICLIVARDAVLKRAGYDLRKDGIFAAPPVTIVLGDEAHSTIYAALRYLGFGDANLARIAVDEEGRMQADDLAARLPQIVGPKIIVAQAGHINSGAFDPFTDIARLAQTHGAWLHIDGAFGLWARATPSLRHHCEGADRADSWSVDGHKWLQTPYDSAFAIVKDKTAHEASMRIAASYLDPPPDGAHDPTARVIELSRRARGFPLWALLQTLGRSGVIEMIERHCACARHCADLLRGDPRIHVMNDVVINQVALAFGPPGEEGDALTAAVIAGVQAENLSYVGGAEWKGRRILRVSVSSNLTDKSHMETLAGSIRRALDRAAS
ncbi:MAG TPA: aminotransferase class V-fold PLP-dependent enzyme [Parvularculaceae bacterium]|nr:aminotransferase class V-fold PLP-dependent enzyme [Parvularculaceae bacterium]